MQTLEDLSEIAAEPFINILANACRGIAVVKQTGRCGSDHVLYGVPGAPLDHLEMLVEAPRLRLSLYRSADDRKGAPYPARRIAQAGYDSENLILAQAGLAEQAFLYMDMNDPHSAVRALDKQEQFCAGLVIRNASQFV